MGRRKFRLGRLPKNYDKTKGHKTVGQPKKLNKGTGSRLKFYTGSNTTFWSRDVISQPSTSPNQMSSPDILSDAPSSCELETSSNRLHWTHLVIIQQTHVVYLVTRSQFIFQALMFQLMFHASYQCLVMDYLLPKKYCLIVKKVV